MRVVSAEVGKVRLFDPILRVLLSPPASVSVLLTVRVFPAPRLRVPDPVDIMFPFTNPVSTLLLLSIAERKLPLVSML